MTGFFEELSEVIMQVIIRPASIDPPSLAHRLRGWRLRGSRTRTLRRHPLRRTPSLIWRACARARSARVPAIVPDQKTKAANSRSGVPFFFLSRWLSLRSERRQVSPLRSETPSLRSGPSGDCARRSADGLLKRKKRFCR